MKNSLKSYVVIIKDLQKYLLKEIIVNIIVSLYLYLILYWNFGATLAGTVTLYFWFLIFVISFMKIDIELKISEQKRQIDDLKHIIKSIDITNFKFKK